MIRTLSLRPVQPMAAAPTSTPARFFASAPYLRAALCGGLALLGSAGSALAQEAPSVKTKQADGQRLFLTVENPAQERLEMKVVSLTDRTCLVNETNHLPSYGSQLNFQGVPAGTYAVLLRVGRERYRYNVQVQSQPQTTISVRELTPANAPAMVASTTR